MAQQPPPQPPSASSSSTDSSVTHLSWEGDKMLNIYVYDYCRKRGFIDTAEHLFKEADIPITAQPPINAPQGLLFEWWTVFWELFTAKSNRNNTNGDASIYLEMQTNRIRAQHHAALQQQQPQPGQAYSQQPLNPGQVQANAMLQKYTALNPKQQPGAASQPAMGMPTVNGFHPQPSHPQQPGPGGVPPQQAPGQTPQAGPSTQPHHPSAPGPNHNLNQLANPRLMPTAQQRAMAAAAGQPFASPGMSHAQPGMMVGAATAGASGNMGPPAQSPHMRAATSAAGVGQGMSPATGQPGSSVNRTPSQQYQNLAGRPGSRSATPMHSSHSSPSYSAGRGGRGATPGAAGEELSQMQRFNLQASELSKMDQELMQYPPPTIKLIMEAAGLGEKQFGTLSMEDKFRFHNEYRRLQASGQLNNIRRQPGMVNGHPANPSAQMMAMAPGGMMGGQGVAQGGMMAPNAGMVGSMGGPGGGMGAPGGGMQHPGMNMIPPQAGMMLGQPHAQHQPGNLHQSQPHPGQGMIPPQAGLHPPQGAGGLQALQHGMTPHQPGMQQPQGGLQSQQPHPPGMPGGMQAPQGGMQHPQSGMQPGLQPPPNMQPPQAGMQPPQAGLHPQGPQRAGMAGGPPRTGIKRASPSDVDTESPPKDASPPDPKRRRRNSQSGINPAQPQHPGQQFQPQAIGGPQTATMNGHPPQSAMNGPQPPSMNGIMGQRNGMPGPAGAAGRPGMMGAMGGGPPMHMNPMMNGMTPSMMNPALMNNPGMQHQLQNLQRMQSHMQQMNGAGGVPSQAPGVGGAQGGPGAQPPKTGLGASPGGPGHDAADQGAQPGGGPRSTPAPVIRAGLNKSMMPPPSPSAKGKEGAPSTPASTHVDPSTASPHTRPASTTGNANPATPNNAIPNYATSTDTSPANASSNPASGGTNSQTISPSMLNSYIPSGASSASTAAGGASSGTVGGAVGGAVGPNTIPNPNQLMSRLAAPSSSTAAPLPPASASALQPGALAAADLFPMIEGFDFTADLGFGGLGNMNLGNVGMKTDDFLEQDFSLYFTTTGTDADGADPITGGAGP